MRKTSKTLAVLAVAALATSAQAGFFDSFFGSSKKAPAASASSSSKGHGSFGFGSGSMSSISKMNASNVFGGMSGSMNGSMKFNMMGQKLATRVVWSSGAYGANENKSAQLTLPAAEGEQIITIKGQTEENADVLTILDKDGNLIGNFSGNICKTIVVNTPSIQIHFTSNGSVNKEGVTVSFARKVRLIGMHAKGSGAGSALFGGGSGNMSIDDDFGNIDPDSCSDIPEFDMNMAENTSVAKKANSVFGTHGHMDFSCGFLPNISGSLSSVDGINNESNNDMFGMKAYLHSDTCLRPSFDISGSANGASKMLGVFGSNMDMKGSMGMDSCGCGIAVPNGDMDVSMSPTGAMMGMSGSMGATYCCVPMDNKQSGTIEGRAYIDRNKNKVFDPADRVVVGGTLVITDANNNTLTTKTDSQGLYSIDGVAAGKAVVDIKSERFPRKYRVRSQVEGTKVTEVKVVSGAKTWEENNGFLGRGHH